MALLIEADRQDVARTWIGKVFVQLANTAGLAHNDVKSAVDAADQWVDDNQTGYNNALPLPFRTTATTAQKTLLLCYVALKRSGVL